MLDKSYPQKSIVIAMLVFLAVLAIVAIASIGVWVAPVVGIFTTCVLMVVMTGLVIVAVAIVCAFSNA